MDIIKLLLSWYIEILYKHYVCEYFFLKDKMIGFQNEMIHIYNKNENVIHDSDYFQNIKHRTNMILMGDSIGDLHMADGAEVGHKLKIGFLNTRVCKQ